MQLNNTFLNTRSGMANVAKVLFILIYLVCSILWLRYVNFDNSIDRWLSEQADYRNSYATFKKEFKTDGLLVLVTERQIDVQKEKYKDSLIASFGSHEGVLGISNWPLRNVILKRKVNPNYNVSIITLVPNSPEHPFRPDVVDHIRETFEYNNLTYYLGGSGVIGQAVNDQTIRNTSLFLSLGLAILIVILFVWTRSLIAVFLTLALALIGIFSIFNISIALGIPISLAHSILPVMALFYSISISMHIITHRGDFRKVVKPTIWAILTTVAGFSAFAFSDIPLLKDFAILGIAGIVSILLGSLLIYFPKVKFHKRTYRALKESYPKKLPGLTFVLALLIGLFVFSGFGMRQLKVEVHSLSVLSEKEKAHRDHLFIEQNIGPYFPVDFIVDEQKMERLAIVKWSHSIYEMESIGAVLSYHRMPKIMDLEKMGYQSSLNPNKYRVTFLVPLLSTADGEKLLNEILLISNKHFEGEQPKLAGFMNSYSQLSTNLIKEFRDSIIYGFLVVFGTFIVFIRQMKLVLISILVNILPVVATLGIMGWFIIRLDMVTVPIACLMLGIVVDDTIHFLYWLQKKKDVNQALKQSGPGILTTSAAMSLGFVILLVADAPPIRYFGLLCLAAILMALIADLFLLPVLIDKLINRRSYAT